MDEDQEGMDEDEEDIKDAQEDDEVEQLLAKMDAEVEGTWYLVNFTC